MRASVAITAYNHARFIRQAIESVLMQRTDFEFEVVIGEDCSTDGTREIVCEYARRYPGRVRAVLHDANVGIWRNYAALYHASRGQYLARLDGDDYWTYPDKLQRQVDFLEANPDYSMCFHSAMLVWEDGAHPARLHCPPERKDTYVLEELLGHDFISASAILVRHKLIAHFPDWYWRTPLEDWSFMVLNALHGKIGYLDECWSVYRQHGAGVFSSLPAESRLEQQAQLMRIFLSALDVRHHPVLRRALAYRLMRLAILHHRAGHAAQARRYAQQYLQESSDSSLTRFRNRVKLSAYMHSPALERFVARVRHAGRRRGKALAVAQPGTAPSRTPAAPIGIAPGA